MNSVEALTNRPTSDRSENGIIQDTGLPRSQAAKVGNACSCPASRLAASAISSAAACRLASTRSAPTRSVERASLGRG